MPEIQMIQVGPKKVDSRLCRRCKFSALCLPIGRVRFAFQLRSLNLLISNWADPTPCGAVDELARLDEQFPIREFKVPEATPQNPWHWGVDWSYRPSYTAFTVITS